MQKVAAKRYKRRAAYPWAVPGWRARPPARARPGSQGGRGASTRARVTPPCSRNPRAATLKGVRELPGKGPQQPLVGGRIAAHCGGVNAQACGGLGQGLQGRCGLFWPEHARTGLQGCKACLSEQFAHRFQGKKTQVRAVQQAVFRIFPFALQQRQDHGPVRHIGDADCAQAIWQQRKRAGEVRRTPESRRCSTRPRTNFWKAVWRSRCGHRRQNVVVFNAARAPWAGVGKPLPPPPAVVPPHIHGFRMPRQENLPRSNLRHSRSPERSR